MTARSNCPNCVGGCDFDESTPLQRVLRPYLDALRHAREQLNVREQEAFYSIASIALAGEITRAIEAPDA